MLDWISEKYIRLTTKDFASLGLLDYKMFKIKKTYC